MIVIVVLLQLFSNVAIGGFGLNRLIHILIAVPSYIVPENKNPAFACGGFTTNGKKYQLFTVTSEACEPFGPSTTS